MFAFVDGLRHFSYAVGGDVQSIVGDLEGSTPAKERSYAVRCDRVVHDCAVQLGEDVRSPAIP